MSPHRREFYSLVARAAASAREGRLDEAAAAYRAALQFLPSHPEVLLNLGVVTAGLGDHRAALANFNAALASEPRYAAAHYNRAVALRALGREQEAVSAFAAALSIEPGNYDAHRAIAFCLLASGNHERALDHFARTYELRRGDDRNGMAAKSLEYANLTKLHHDAQQFRHLASLGRDARQFEALARSYEAVARVFPENITRLCDADLERLGDSYNTAIHMAEAPAIPAGTLAARPDREQLLSDFTLARPGAVYFDDLLTPQAVTRLRCHLLQSTMWHDFTHIEGFVAAYLEDGLACPLLLQIVTELRGRFPELLSDYPLTQAWAFKAVRTDAAVDVHTDDGAVSLNFWMTPTDANGDPGRGGLGICLMPPPADWAVQDYRGDQRRARDFLQCHRERTLTVPYRVNRGVLFESRLIHYSDAPHFLDGYLNHRINLTMLFGTGGRPPETPHYANVARVSDPPFAAVTENRPI